MKQSPSRAALISDPAAEHLLKNHLAVILGYCQLLLRDTSEADPRHGDLLEMQRAATAALAMIDPGPAA